jgi:nitrate reductase NapD
MTRILDRRQLLTGDALDQSDLVFDHVISSAIVFVLPGRQDDVVAALTALPDTEIGAIGNNSKIVVLLEGRTRGEVGARLAHIGSMDGVISANVVFEHADEVREIQS